MAEASSLERRSPGLASCLSHSLCPGEPGLQTTAVVSMGSADHQFHLAEILSRNYGVREEHEGAARGPEKPEEELEKDFVSQSSDMPLDELLALYGYEASDPISERQSEGSDAAANLPDMTLDKEQIAKDLLSGEEEEETQSSADDLTPSVTSHEASDLFPNQSGPRFLPDADKEPGSSSSSDTEEDPLPANKCKKEIMVGPQFQADLSKLHSNRQGEKIYENEDQLLWDPNILPEREVEEFLYRAVKRRWHEVAESQLPEGEAVKDSEQALYELVKCNFNAEEALRRLRFNVKVIRDGLCAWSEEERRNFEHGFRVHGKNFHLIQANKMALPGAPVTPTLSEKWACSACSLGRGCPTPSAGPVRNRAHVRTRSVGECVEYYYLWKKSERYDYFSQQTRLGRRKYGPSGTTDADQDLDGGDPDGPGRPRSSPPLPLPATADGPGPERDALARMRTEPLSVGSSTSGSLGEPGEAPDGPPSSEPGPCSFQPLDVDAPSAVPLPRRPPALAEPAFYSPTTAAPEPGASPRLAVDLALPGALPEELPLISSHVDMDGEPEEAVAPAQVALSVAEFGLIGIGDVNPFLATHPACPAPGLHSEPLSHCNVMTC
ncbi:mesoderm induction early response protein 2 isoform X1 [Balaenoptera ricei]|uniref:mesoderm induction early response protein 2 isoform X1 n=2 Tax=Balaenoptera ricei TaxID=2746895 RepID=UPI0028BE3758|nr:mesoderm induction early response protein 2 isoform X1 [Balaenoptera ricei]